MKDTLIEALQRYPVFTVREMAQVLGKSSSYAYLVAYRLKKSGIIQEIERGKYTRETDPFLIASWILWPSYLSGWAALQYHHLTEQLPFTLQVITTRKRNKKSLRFHGTSIEFSTIRKAAFTGFKKIMYQNREIFIAEPEKAIVDGLRFETMSFPEAQEIIGAQRRKINKRKLFRYAKLISLAPQLRAQLKRVFT